MAGLAPVDLGECSYQRVPQSVMRTRLQAYHTIRRNAHVGVKHNDRHDTRGHLGQLALLSPVIASSRNGFSLVYPAWVTVRDSRESF